MMDRKEVYRTAIGKWGKEMQLTVAIEEMSELTKEICKHFRGEKNLDAISEEMADVTIMLEQMMLIYNNEKSVSRWRDAKVDRLRRAVSE